MIKAAPDLFVGYQGLGTVVAYEGRYPEAVAIFRKSLELKPNDKDYSNLATVYFNQRDFDRAIETYQNAIALGYDEYTFWMNLGDAYYCTPAMLDQAEPAYRTGISRGLQALNEDPKDAGLLARLADAYARIGETDSARAYLARAELLAGEDGDTYQWLGLAQWQLGRREEALDALARALKNRVPAVYIRDSAMFDPWRGDPGFQMLVPGGESHRAAPASVGQHAGG
jgi:tetratricopeptide (TPR) repeat protein